MKRNYKIIFTILVFVTFIIFISNVHANSINKITMDIYIDNNGDAFVTEIWDCYTNSGSEVYHPYYNLGNSKIKDLSVQDGNKEYSTLYNWNSNYSFQEKANKCGIKKINDGIELCWGMSEYGYHTYTVTYTITNFVAELNDSQMIYWTLIPHNFSNTIGKVDIKLHTDFRILDSIDVWGYGNYGGTAYVYNGAIEMNSRGALKSDEYMTILVKFPLGTFDTNNKIGNDFNYYYTMSQKGSKKYNVTLIIIIFLVITLLVLFLVYKLSVKLVGLTGRFIRIFNYGPNGSIRKSEITYFRDIPLNNDLFKAYCISYMYNISKKDTDLLGAIILKWLKDKKIKLEEKEKNGLTKKKITNIILTETNADDFDNEQEKNLFKMLYLASIDGILESKEFEKWCSNNYERILSWFSNEVKHQQDKLAEEGLLTKKKNLLGIYKYTATKDLKAFAMQLAGLKKFLEDYTLINDRRALEVYLFEDYLIYAQLFGIADKVRKQFKDLYPELIKQSNFSSYEHITWISVNTSRAVLKANSAKNFAKAYNYSSGGGGFSSGGGGGGSFGGGSGRRWIPLKSYFCTMHT